MNEKTVQEWLKYADEDFKGGKILFENNPEEFKTLVCFHMQQSVEKNLKAYLVSNNTEIDTDHREHYTHNIAKIIEECKKVDPDFDNLYALKTDELTKYAVGGKYPFQSGSISLEDERTAIFIAEQVKPFVIKKINELSPIIGHKQDIKNGPVPAEKEPIQTKPDIYTEVIKRKFKR